MLETLTQGFKNAKLKLAGKTKLTEDNISEALTDVRRSLLEADVELGVVRTFLDRVRERSLGEVVSLKAPTTGHGVAKGMKVTPADHFVKISSRRARPADGPSRHQPGPRRPSGRHHDGRSPGVGKDHHSREDRSAPEG